MAITQDEFVVKVRADTNSYTKELKKLRKTLSQTFNPHKNGIEKDSKETVQEYRDLSRRIADQLDFSKVFEKNGAEMKKTIKQVTKESYDIAKKTKAIYEEIARLSKDPAIKKSMKPFIKEQKELLKLYKSGYAEEHPAEMFERENKRFMPVIKAYNKFHEATVNARPKNKEDMAYVKETKLAYDAELEKLKKTSSGKYLKKALAGMTDEYNQRLEAEQKIAEEKQKSAEEEKKNKGGGFLARTWESIKNIAKNFFIFRQVRKFFNSLNQLWAQGTQNAYEYSRATDGIFAKLLDKKNSMKTAFANSLGALNATLTQIFTPIVTQFYEVLTKLVNKLAEVLAKLFQLPEYLQARTNILDRWGDRVKETRQLIQGFDELNIFQGNDNTLPKDMFYTVKNEDKYAGFWEAFGEILTTIKTFFTPFWQKALKVGIDVLGKVKDWWNGVEDTDEDENGREITRVVEPGAKHAVKEWLGGMANGFKTWFLGDETRGTEGFWQKHLKPWLAEALAGFKSWLAIEIGKIVSAIQDYFGHKGDEVAVSIGLADSVEEAEAVRHNKLPGVGGYVDPNGPKGKDMTPWLLALLTGGIPFPLWMNAKGGVYTKPAIGLVGEASSTSNPELITPTQLLDSRLQANNSNLISAFSQMTSQIISAIGNVDMNVTIGDEVIGQSCSRANSAYYKMTGRPLIR